MGNPKQKWTAAEEDALRAGIKKHGTGKWKNIQKDPEFNPLLYSRSNIDLKDKWRNMSVSVSGQGPREKSRTPKTKDSPVNVGQTSGSSSLLVVNSSVASNDVHMEDSSRCFLDGKIASKYNSTLKDPNGSNTSAVGSFIEVQNGHRLKGEVTNGNKGPKMKPKEIRPRSSPINSYLGETLEEAAIGAAYKVAEAENKSFVAAAAVKEAERVSRMAEEAEAFLRLAEEIYDRCNYSQPCFRKVVS